MEVSFKPYDIHLKNLEQINEFNSLSNLSYGLAQQLLFKYPQTDSSPIVLGKEELKVSSYSMADLHAAETIRICTWISFQEYAEKTGNNIKIIEEMAINGQLGPIQKHPTSGNNILIWPSEFKNRKIEDLPEPGKSKYKVRFTVDASAAVDLDIDDMNNFEEIQKKFLHLAHSIGKPDEVTTRANEMLNKSSLIMHWTAFEVYLRSTIHELFRLNPRILLDDKQVGKTTITYKDIFSLSSGFSNIDELRSSIVELEIERQESDGKSVHGLINFLKNKFKFKDDPYEGWYIHKGTKFNTHYNDLLEIKEVRNALIHDAGFPNKSFFIDYPSVPSSEGRIVIDEDYYLKCDLILRTIAFKIAKSVSACEYIEE